jgi:GntR family transcriptional regulator, transcriptional repressor for pyruvate dehydrogenase complex
MPATNENTSLTEQTVASLKEMIVLSGARPGDRFGNEADLERKLGVSRVVVREAVSRLRALGILESRQGLGLIIGKPDPFGLLEQTLTRHTLDSTDLAALEELRNTLEIGAVELAVKRATEAQVDRLVELAEELGEFRASSSSSRTADDVELDFHRTILEATHNTMLGQMYPVLAVVFSRRERELPGYPTKTTTEQTVWEHRMIARAFRERNVECARALLCMHLASSHTNLETSSNRKEEQ